MPYTKLKRLQVKNYPSPADAIAAAFLVGGDRIEFVIGGSSGTLRMLTVDFIEPNWFEIRDRAPSKKRRGDMPCAARLLQREIIDTRRVWMNDRRGGTYRIHPDKKPYGSLVVSKYKEPHRGR